MRASCLAVAVLALIASRADAAIIDWQAELQRCRALRQNVAPLLQAGEGISAVGRSNRSVRREARRRGERLRVTVTKWRALPT
ncbi:hypothetical protein [Bradyrhizobium japonicum]|uniref:hypothetical protein n=1 Tax=Bradyrhizobium japonicum TaxID=375 RepID=UPI002013A0C0|nr:hypothetical protein [Bradyrhizobium japonicum]